MSFDSYGPSTYGDVWAAVYDDEFHAPGDAESVAAFLASFARGGPALELGIGTGRVALPLAARGVEVKGVDASRAMVDQMRQKPGGDAIDVAFGDFADVPIDGDFALVYVVFNTLFALLTQEDQVRCFKNVAAHLRPSGRFVIEAFVPDVARYARGQYVQTRRVDVDGVILDVARLDAATQVVTSQVVALRRDGVRLLPVKLRFAWPSELDLMAQLAGLELRERWSGWRQEPFTGRSTGHVSVYAPSS